jgi:hypothetical protein
MSEQVPPWLVQTRKTKNAVFVLLHFSNTCVFEKCPAFRDRTGTSGYISGSLTFVNRSPIRAL